VKFEKGHIKKGGREKGTGNKVTGRAKELLLLAIDEQSDKFNQVMNNLANEEPKEWAKIMVNLFKYVAPEKIDLTTNDKELNIPVVGWASNKKIN
jgi:hypothetical protein